MRMNDKEFKTWKREHGVYKRTSRLNQDELAIINLVKKNPNATTGQVYELYREQEGKLSDRSFRRYITNLSELGFINSEKTRWGFLGQSRILNFPETKNMFC